MRHLFRFLLVAASSLPLFYSCNTDNSNRQGYALRPKLVVGIVVDQMRWDYLYRYRDKYNANGFKRLLRQGLSCQNTHINYLPSYTGPGHSCIYTGSVPAINGIAGNAWFDCNQLKTINCVQDDSVKLVGLG